MADPNLLLNRAKAALLARDYQLAAKYYKTLISENPDVLDYKIALGNLYVKSGDDDSALNVFNEIEKSNPENLTVLMAIAGIYRRKKMFDNSVAVLEQALLISNNTPSDSATINYNLGFTYRQMGNNDEAIRCFENVIEQNPKDVLAYNHLGAIHALRGDHNKAIWAYKRGLQFDPNHPILHFNLARSYAETGETQKALSNYEAALRARPGWLDAIEEYADLLLKTNQVPEAERTVQNALKLNPEDVKMHTSMGNVYNRKSIYDSAELEFKKALKGDDEYKPALTGLARSLEKQGKHEEAAETISKASRLNPDDVAVIKQSAEVLLSANFLPAAYEKLQRLWELNQNDPQTISLLGQYHILKGNESKIEECFDKIQQNAPDYKDVYRDWGARFIQAGDNKRAEKYLNTAIQQNPRDAESMIYLGEIYENSKRAEDALSMYKRARHADSYNERSRKEISKLRSMGVKEVKRMDFEGEPQFPPVENYAPQQSKISGFDDLLEAPENKSDDKGKSENKTVKNPENPDEAKDLTENAGKEEDEGETSFLEGPDLSNKNLLDESKTDGESKSEDLVPEKDGDSISPENSKDQDKDGGGQNLSDGVDFDFDQFGNENLKDEKADNLSVGSINDIMQKEDLDRSENPHDIEELVDDGEPFDDDLNVDMEFIPDGTDLADSASDSNGQTEDKDGAETKEKPDEKIYEEIDDLKSKVDETSKIAKEAKDTAQKVIERMKNLPDPSNFACPIEENKDDEEDEDVPDFLDSSAWKNPENAGVKQAFAEPPKILEKDSDAKKPEEQAPLAENAPAAEEKAPVVEEKIPAAEEKPASEELSADETPATEEKPADELTAGGNLAAEEEPESETSVAEEEPVPESGPADENPAEDELPADENLIPEEDSISEREEIQAAGKKTESLSPDELIMKRAIDMLPEIESAIEDRVMFFKFKSYLEMFKSLRGMIDFLPEPKKQEFMSSKTRILLDYLISKFSGKPGLYATSKALRNSGIIHENPAVNASENDGVDLVKEVLKNIRRLAESLDDETLRIALDSKNEELMSKLI